MTSGQVVDPKSRVDRSGNIFRVYRTFRAPAWVCYSFSERGGAADDSAAPDASAREERRMDEVMIPPVLGGDVAHSPPEFAFGDNQGFIQQRVSIGPWNRRQVRDQAGQTEIQSPRRRRDAGVRCIDVLMVIP